MGWLFSPRHLDILMKQLQICSINLTGGLHPSQQFWLKRSDL
ncbi:hypothetical protein Gotur_026400 [Gossypium turneri]